MTEIETAFASFREAVFDDHDLLASLRAPMEREAYIARVVATGAERGLHFDTDVVRAALREGEQAWLMQGVEVVA